ncbi:MAG TPA: protein kinase [Pyrinomonadaceae bacterium]|jgi:serine/threonine protein kinase|nr:protein kinase [Pyrinomonadaceae bacterium]
MNAELWKQVDALLDAALDLPPEKREQFVLEACDGNDELRAEVLSLVKAQSQASSFMERSAMRVAAQALAADANLDSNLTTHVSLVGHEIGTYKIEKLLGAGGMGEVYLAHETKLNRRVALKILPWQFVADAERTRRFEREAQALSALNHPNLITIYEVGVIDNHHFIAMEFVEGRTLREIMSGVMKLRDVLAIVAQVAEALSAAHHSGIIHRDIKPENIMVRADGYVKVLDFGLAKLAEVDLPTGATDGAVAVAHTQAGATMGTLAYMSPEQATGETIDHRTDIWSLGVVLYELVTRQKPFRGANRQSTVNAILSSEPNSATASDPALPTELDLVFDKALEKDRELRYQTASDFRADVRRLLRSMDSAPSSSRQRLIAAKTKPRPRRWLWPAVAVVAIALGTPVAWFWLRSIPRAPDWSRATHIQLTDQPGTEFFPSLAPDGKSFVYASKAGGNFDLFLQRVGGKNPTLLTKDSAADDTQPVFSPDGERIAFHSERNPAGIYVMEATGENLRPVTTGGFHPSWSPDGKELVFSEAGRDSPDVRNTLPSKLWVVNVESGARRLLTERDAMQPAWSPHGSRIAFWFMPPSVGRSDIATIPRGGGEPVVITKDASTNWNPVWSSDGKFLYFASDRSGNMNFWRVALDEETGKVLSEPEAIVTPSKFSRHLSFSRDGKRMIYVQTENQSNIQAAVFDANKEKVVGEAFWITRGDRQIVRPELTADGKQFVMRVPRRTQDDIVVVSRDGTNWRDLTNDKFFDRYPRWSPDGKRIAFASDRSGAYEIWIIDTDGTNLKQATFGGKAGTSFPLWSPDGRQLVFRTNDVSYAIDLSRDFQQQTPETILPPDAAGNVFTAWDWSPDGKTLAGTFHGPAGTAIGCYSFATKSYQRFADYFELPMWLPDSRRFGYVHEGKVFIANTKTKKVREIYSHEPEEIRSAAVSRDGQLLYYTVSSSESDIWLLDLD